MEVVKFFWRWIKVGLGTFYSFALEYIKKVKDWIQEDFFQDKLMDLFKAYSHSI